MDFLIPNLFSVILSKTILKEKSAQVNTSRVHCITSVIIGDTHFRHCSSTKICSLYKYTIYSFKSITYSWISSTHSLQLSSESTQTSLWF